MIIILIIGNIIFFIRVFFFPTHLINLGFNFKLIKSSCVPIFINQSRLVDLTFDAFLSGFFKHRFLKIRHHQFFKIFCLSMYIILFLNVLRKVIFIIFIGVQLFNAVLVIFLIICTVMFTLYILILAVLYFKLSLLILYYIAYLHFINSFHVKVLILNYLNVIAVITYGSSINSLFSKLRLVFL